MNHFDFDWCLCFGVREVRFGPLVTKKYYAPKRWWYRNWEIKVSGVRVLQVVVKA